MYTIVFRNGKIKHPKANNIDELLITMAKDGVNLTNVRNVFCTVVINRKEYYELKEVIDSEKGRYSYKRIYNRKRKSHS